jgi:sodium/bile acid cotransporter 7
MLYFHTSGSEMLNVRAIFASLFRIVVVPMLLGWVLHNYVALAYAYYVRHRRRFKKAQESCLVFIIYCTFCGKFFSDAESNGGSTVVGLSEVAVMVVLVAILMAAFGGIAWVVLGRAFPGEPELRVTGVFACHHKTIALGVPLIGSLYKDHPDLALYTLAILVWHPLQLVAGSFLVPSLSSYIRHERQSGASAPNSPAGPAAEDEVLDGKRRTRGGRDGDGTETTGLLVDEMSSQSSTPPHAALLAGPYGSILEISV